MCIRDRDIRREIDAIDDQLIPLLCRRMDCSLRVASYKAAHGLPVLNEEREQQVLEQVRAVCCKEGRADYAEAAALVFASTMDVSRALQHRALGALSLIHILSPQSPSSRNSLICRWWWIPAMPPESPGWWSHWPWLPSVSYTHLGFSNRTVCGASGHGSPLESSA